MAGSLNSPDFSSVSKAEKTRRAEKKASAKLRGRKSFDDQSNVDKIYQWIKENYEVEQRDVRAELARQRAWEEEQKKRNNK